MGVVRVGVDQRDGQRLDVLLLQLPQALPEPRFIERLDHVTLGADALVRLRATAPLGELGAVARAEVVAELFAPRRGAGARLAGQKVVLIDDVLTSGATATECCHALQAAGAARVDVLVAARVPDPRLR